MSDGFSEAESVAELKFNHSHTAVFRVHTFLCDAFCRECDGLEAHPVNGAGAECGQCFHMGLHAVALVL